MYRYYILILVIFVLCCGRTVQAQVKKPTPYMRTQADVAKSYPTIIKANVLSLLVLTANFGYEKFISPTKSAQLGIYYSNLNIRENSDNWLNLPVARYKSFGLSPEFRFYLDSRGRPKLDGWFVAPFFQFSYTKVLYQQNPGQELEQNNKQFKAAIGIFRLGTIGGYKFILNDRLSFEAFAGPAVRGLHWYSANNGTYSKNDFLRFPIGIRSGLTLGYAF